MPDRFLHFLIQLDYTAWYYLNNTWHDPLFDYVIPYLRNQWFWAPLYFFLLLYMPTTFKKKGWVWCLGFFITFVIADQLSAGLLKPYFHRLRPCNQAELSEAIHLIVNCGGIYGFPSSHAANHFALGIFSAITLSKRYKWVWPAALIWATLVSYAQVYVGVHFPADVAFGGVLGATAGAITGLIFNKLTPLFLTNQMVISSE